MLPVPILVYLFMINKTLLKPLKDSPVIFNPSSKTVYSSYCRAQTGRLVTSSCKEENSPAGMLSSYKSFITVVLTAIATLHASGVHATHMDVNNQTKPELLFPWLLSELHLH